MESVLPVQRLRAWPRVLCGSVYSFLLGRCSCLHLQWDWAIQQYCCYCLVPKSYLTLCNPMDCSPPGSSVHGIIQVRILEWVAIPFSRGSSQSRDQTLQADSLPAEPQGIGHGQKKSLFLPSPSPSRLGTDGDSSQGGVPSPFWVFHPEVQSDWSCCPDCSGFSGWGKGKFNESRCFSDCIHFIAHWLKFALCAF